MSSRFECIPLTSVEAHKELIQRFSIDREKDFLKDSDDIEGLEAYLKRCAWDDDVAGEVRIYLIKDVLEEDVAAYFGLKAGMVADAREGFPSSEKQKKVRDGGGKLLPCVLPGIEISHLAVNDAYRHKMEKNSKPIRRLCEYFYPQFIFPIIHDVAQKIGVKLIYLYAAGDEALVAYYKNVFQFQTLDDDDDNSFYVPLQPLYDYDCKFMFKLIAPSV